MTTNFDSQYGATAEQQALGSLVPYQPMSSALTIQSALTMGAATPMMSATPINSFSFTSNQEDDFLLERQPVLYIGTGSKICNSLSGSYNLEETETDFPKEWAICTLLTRCPLSEAEYKKRQHRLKQLRKSEQYGNVLGKNVKITYTASRQLTNRLWKSLCVYLVPEDKTTGNIVPAKAWHGKLLTKKNEKFNIPPPYSEIICFRGDFRSAIFKCYMAIWKSDKQCYEYEEIVTPDPPTTGAATYALMNENGAFYHGKNF